MAGPSTVFVADLLDALRVLEVRTPATALAVMRMLHLDDWQAMAPQADRSPEPTKARHAGPVAAGAPDPVVNQPLQRPADAGAPQSDAQTLETVTVQALPPDVAALAPGWLAGPVLPRASRGPSPPSQPLFDPRHARALLGALAASWAPSGAVDMQAAIDLLARAMPLTSLPRQHSWRTAGGLQLLLDDGPGMAPFRHDIAWLLTQLERLFPAEQLEVLRFEGTPMRGCRSRRKRGRWPWQVPVPGRALLLVTEFGIADAEPLAARGGPHEWLGFAAATRAAGTQLRALVPYPPERWPAMLAGAFRPVHWDRWTTVATVRQRAGDQARAAGH